MKQSVQQRNAIINFMVLCFSVAVMLVFDKSQKKWREVRRICAIRRHIPSAVFKFDLEARLENPRAHSISSLANNSNNNVIFMQVGLAQQMLLSIKDMSKL